MKKLGILSGTFDPVHKGHVDFALESIKVCGLERVYLLPERSPRRKKNLTDFAHRLEMLKLAAGSHKQLEVLQVSESRFTNAVTLPKLRSQFAPDQLVFLMGSDVAATLGGWPGLKPLIVGLRNNDDRRELEKLLSKLRVLRQTTFITSPRAQLASSQLRNSQLKDLDPLVLAYIKRHKLYS